MSADIEVTIQRVEQDGNWFNILTDQGKFSTQIVENAQEAVSLVGQRVLLNYDEQVKTKPAPDGSGMRTYRNRYYNRAATVANVFPSQPTAGIVPVGQGPIPQAQSNVVPLPGAVQAEGGENPRRSWRICLQTGGKLAVQTMPLMPVEQRDFETQKTIAIAWAKFFYFTPVPQETQGTSMPPLAPDEDPWAGIETQDVAPF